MKNKPRSVQDNSKKAAASQLQKPNRAQGRAGDGVVTIVILTSNGKRYCRLRLHGGLYAIMPRVMKKMDWTLPKFLMAAVENYEAAIKSGQIKARRPA